MDDESRKAVQEFLRPRLVGNRFDGHAIPLELLRDIAALEPMILEAARIEYLRGHEDRQRLPNGFMAGLSLVLSGVQEGSAVASIDLEVNTEQGFQVEAVECLQKARDSILEAIDAAGREEPVGDLLSPKTLAQFNQIGRRIRPGEAIDFSPSLSGPAVRLSREARRHLVHAASESSRVLEEVIVKGGVEAVDHKRNEFRVLQTDGRKVTGPLRGTFEEVVLEGCSHFEDGAKVQIRGIGEFARTGSLARIDSVDHAVILDPMDISLRIDELRALRSGWLDGAGRPLPRDGLDWLGDCFDRWYPRDLGSPFLYPTEESQVRAEWPLGDVDASIEVDLTEKSGAFHAFNFKTGRENVKTLDLAGRGGWEALIALLRDSRPVEEAK